jgi:hypothetical protein
MIRYRCPSCNREQESATALAGLVVICLNCKHPIQIPPGDRRSTPDNVPCDTAVTTAGPRATRPPEHVSVAPAPPPGPPTPERPAPARSTGACLVCGGPLLLQDVPHARCARCRLQEVHPPSPSAPEEAKPWKATTYVALAVLVVLLLVVWFQARSETGVWLYVDNGGDRPLVVSVDGAQQLTVRPRTFGIVKWSSGGRKQITVARAGVVLFDESKELISGSPRKYLLNPDATNRYCSWVAHYGIAGFNVQFVRDEAEHYRKLAGTVTLVPPSAWVEQGHDYVLEAPPRSLRTSSSSEERRVLTRISDDDYRRLDAAQHAGAATGEDLRALRALLDRIMRPAG